MKSTNSIFCSIEEYGQLYRDIRTGKYQKCESPFELNSTITPEADNIYIYVSGLLVPGESQAQEIRWFGFPATSYESLYNQIKQAQTSSAKEVYLIVNSGGGYVSGIDRVLSALKKLKNYKTVKTYIDGFAASAAYWIGSISDEITATTLAQVGGIGAFLVMYDTSKVAETMGLKTYLIKSTQNKGAGSFGAPIVETAIESEQKIIDSIGTKFIADIEMYREVYSKEEAYNGSTHLSDEAKRMGLIDKISDEIEDISNNQTEDINMKRKQFIKKLQEEELIPDEEEKDPVTEDEMIPDEEEEEPAVQDEDIPDEEEEEPAVQDEEVIPAVQDEEPAVQDEENPDEEEEELPPAVKKERSRCMKLYSLFAHSPKFVNECIVKGYTVQQAKAKAYDKKVFGSKGTNRIKNTINSGTSFISKNEHPAIQAAKEIAFKEKISLSKAMEKVSKLNPSLISDYYNS